MGDNLNRSDSQEVDTINHLLFWSLGGTAFFLVLVFCYYCARIDIDQFFQSRSTRAPQRVETSIDH
ncbi:hypothetical protein GC174_06670 [bacterium]|nr:hypothetical protein [bacterium]